MKLGLDGVPEPDDPEYVAAVREALEEARWGARDALHEARAEAKRVKQARDAERKRRARAKKPEPAKPAWLLKREARLAMVAAELEERRLAEAMREAYPSVDELLKERYR